MIIAIAGGARTGKTTLGTAMALTSGTALLSTDSLIPLGWSEASQAAAARILTTQSDLIVEGVAVARALRKALAQSNQRPCDRLIVLCTIRRPGVIAGSIVAQAKGVWTVLGEIAPELLRRGVEVEMRGDPKDVRTVHGWMTG